MQPAPAVSTPADVAADQAGPPEQAGRPASRPDRAGAAAVVVFGYVAVVSALTLLGLLLTRVLLPGPGGWDIDATRWLAERRSGALDAATGLFSRSGDTAGILVIALVLVVGLWARGRRDQMAVLVTALALELTAFLAVNHLVGRDRPDVPKLDAVPSTGSFPSGHTAATLVLYVALAVFANANARATAWRALAWAAAIVMPVAVAFSRVYRGLHHPTDVLFGLVLGGAVLLLAIVAVWKWAPARRRAR